jgi:hypothetical protein
VRIGSECFELSFADVDRIAIPFVGSGTVLAIAMPHGFAEITVLAIVLAMASARVAMIATQD